MNEPEIIEDTDAIILKCPDCGKMRDAIAFAPQLPKDLAPDGFVKCTCAQQYGMALLLGAMGRPQSHEVSPGVYSHTWILTYPEDMNATIDSFAFEVAPTGQLAIQAKGRAKKSFMAFYRKSRAEHNRERRRKQIARRQKRAAFRRLKRGLA
jgi:ssDNA-binding Zn-finger/Zn-ribbon topoisomerase 1